MPLFGSRGAASVTGFGGLSAKLGYLLRNSLRFRSSASAFLNRTFPTAGNTQKFTESIWTKRGTLGVAQWFGVTVSGNASYGMYFDTDDSLYFFIYYTGSVWQGQLYTTQLFRDPAAWYHIVLAVDTTQAVASNRVKVYVNGVQVTSFSTENYPNQNQTLNFNSAAAHFVNQISSSYYDGYIAELNWIDGQALTPSSFAKTDPATGQWIPIKYSGTYGTNGFYLPFTNTTSTSTLGNDFSGNGNTWTVNNISLTAGATYDSMTDVPTLTSATAANYCVFNPLVGTHANTYSNGNLQVATSTSNAAFSTQMATFGISSGKWYWEITCQATVDAFYVIGIAADTVNPDSQYVGQGNSYAYRNDTGQKATGGTFSAYGATFTTGDIISVVFDADAGTLVFHKNGVTQGTAFTSISGTYFPAVSDLNNDTGRNSTFIGNWGQRPFAYTPPSGFKSLNTFNLP